MQTKGFMEADSALQRDQVVHQARADLPVVETAAVDAKYLGNHLEALRGRAVVERHHVLHQHGVAQAMG